MVTSNSGESRSKNTRQGEAREKNNNYRNGEKREFRPYKKEAGGNSREGSQKKDRNEAAKGSGIKTRDSYKNGDNPGMNKPFKKKYGERNYGSPYDKDEEETNVRNQKRQTSPKEGKVKEQQPDKFEIKNRIEKEKKAMQKKQSERKNSKPSRMQSRPKRTNNIDWTREYENGSYDDDELDMYL